jgi:DNA polymerase-3 subunit gamma/tau
MIAAGMPILMSYLVLARKYRPQTFEQVVQQEHVTKTLSNAILANRVAHALLFSGPRGTGKTTVARIMAKAMNCQEGPTPTPCNQCRSCVEITAGNCPDVFEIDGASNNSVDQIRELRENIRYMPAHSRYKIYIIDEVHMLSLSAFNALLKTLEEPPAHILFMFATTEPQKIPITILSRCQRHDLRRMDASAISQQMARICSHEGFDMASDSLAMIAREAGGCMRDALSLLDQVLSCSDGAMEPGKILDLLGVIDRKVIFDLSAAVLEGQLSAVLELIDDAYRRGQDMRRLYAEVLDHYRNLVIVKMGADFQKFIDLPAHEIDTLKNLVAPYSTSTLSQTFELLFKEEAALRFATQPKLALEMIFFKIVQLKPNLAIDELIAKLDYLKSDRPCPASEPLTGQISSSKRTEPTQATADASDLPLQRRSPPRPVAQEDASLPADPDGGPGTVADARLSGLWPRLVTAAAKEKPSIGAILGKCDLKEIGADQVTIEVRGNGYTLKMIQKHLPLLHQLCERLAGRSMNIRLLAGMEENSETRDKKAQANLMKREALAHPMVSEAIAIFNGELSDIKIL